MDIGELIFRMRNQTDSLTEKIMMDIYNIGSKEIVEVHTEDNVIYLSDYKREKKERENETD